MTDFFASTPKGIEPLLARELEALGAASIKPTRAGVAFQGDLATAYRVCLWSRLANRVLLPLFDCPAKTPEQLYAGIQGHAWDEHLAPEGTLAVDFVSAQSHITHTQYGAQKVKDAIVDQFREQHGVRPSVDRERPDIRVNVYVYKNRARVSLDLSGESLHRRGYRTEGGEAPLKENLAAAILVLAQWPEIAAGGGALLDPMCGSGTLPIEAALMAGDCAPGLLRSYFGFLRWKKHDPAPWEALLAEARNRRTAGLERLPPIAGCDNDPRAVSAALANVDRAGLKGRIAIERRELDGARAPVTAAQGLVVANPPYGERLGEQQELVSLYSRLGTLLRTHFAGWRAAVFRGNPQLAASVGLPARRIDTLWNGTIECRLFQFAVEPKVTEAPAPIILGPGAEMLANRLRKNLRHLGRWARRTGVGCYRLYDADLPEYALAVDLYQGEKLWVHVQEYAPPANIDPLRAEARLAEALATIPQVLEIPPAQMFFKVRRRQKGGTQYEKLGGEGRFSEVREGPCRLLVNFTDYLDTGLFLDHRITRALVGQLAQGRHFLNLFAYTGAATVHAAHGGARSTTTVDMSGTYLDWARRNLALNGFTGPEHQLVQADCTRWLAEADPKRRRYGLIFLDPPTFSTSKRMEATFDVQRDHVTLIRQAARLLEPDGVLIFSTNRQRFKLDEPALAGLQIEDISAATIPEDFARNPKIHRCWRIRLGGSV